MGLARLMAPPYASNTMPPPTPGSLPSRVATDEITASIPDDGKGPVEAYLDAEGIVALAKEKHIDAIHPGYGFLSENPALPRACERGRLLHRDLSRSLARPVGRSPEPAELARNRAA